MMEYKINNILSMETIILAIILFTSTNFSKNTIAVIIILSIIISLMRNKETFSDNNFTDEDRKQLVTKFENEFIEGVNVIKNLKKNMNDETKEMCPPKKRMEYQIDENGKCIPRSMILMSRKTDDGDVKGVQLYYKNARMEYDGEMLNGKAHGMGIKYYENGSKKEEGEFENDTLIEGLAYTKDNKVIKCSSKK